MIEDKLTNPLDYYDIDVSNVGKPWLNVDGGSGITHHLLLEVLPTSVNDGWLKKFVVSQYRWKISLWSSSNERISSDVLLPITTTKQFPQPLGMGASSSSSSSAMGSAFNQTMGASSSSSFMDSSSNNASSSSSSKKGGTKEVFVFDLDFASITLAEKLGEYAKGNLGGSRMRKNWSQEQGVHMVVELVQESSGIPVSRGMVHMCPSEELDSSFYNKDSDKSSSSSSSSSRAAPAATALGSMTYNQCYSVSVPVATSPSRTTGMESSVKRASSGAEMHVPVNFAITASFVKCATRATQWTARSCEAGKGGMVGVGRVGANVKLVTLPSHVPSLADVLPSTLRYRLPPTATTGTGAGAGAGDYSADESPSPPLSPSKQAREAMVAHLRNRSRPCRVYACVADMHISDDLLELCKADRIVLTAHVVDPTTLPPTHRAYQSTNDSHSSTLAALQQRHRDETKRMQEEIEAKAAAEDAELADSLSAMTPTGLAVSKVMHATPPSHPGARPTALAEMASNAVGDYHKCVELLTLAPPDHHTAIPGGGGGLGNISPGPSGLSGFQQPGHGGNNKAQHHLDSVPRIVQIGLQGFSCIGNNTQLMREHIKFAHNTVELCTGQITLEDLVIGEEGEHGHESEEDRQAASRFEVGGALVSGTYRVPLYTEPTKVIVASNNRSVRPAATGVLVGEVFVHVAVQRDAGLCLERLHLNPSPLGGVNSSPAPGSPSHNIRGSASSNINSNNHHGLGGSLLPAPTLSASQTPEAVAGRLLDMLDSPRSLTAYRILLCVSGDSEHVLQAEARRDRMRAAGIPLPYDEDDDSDNEEEHDSGGAEEGGSTVTSPLLPSLLAMFGQLFVPLPGTAIIDLIVAVEARLRDVSNAAAGATVGINADAGAAAGTTPPSMISPHGALFMLLMMLLERLMVDEHNCDLASVELIARSIDDRGASSVLWHYFQACLRVPTVGAILHVARHSDRNGYDEDDDDDDNDEDEEAPPAPSALTWRQLRVACFCMRLLAATSWVDRNPRVGDMKDAIIAGLPAGASPPLRSSISAGSAGNPGFTSRRISTVAGAGGGPRRSTIGRAGSAAGNRRASSNVSFNAQTPMPHGARRRRSSAINSTLQAANVTMPGAREALDGELPNNNDWGDGYNDDGYDDGYEDGAYPYYHTTATDYHDGSDSHTVSLCKDITSLLLAYSRRLAVSLLHDYRVCEVTVNEHGEDYRSQGQEDFAQQALRELDGERVETCLEMMSCVRHTLQCVSCLWGVLKPKDMDAELLNQLLGLVKVLPMTPLNKEEVDDEDDDEESEDEDEDDGARRSQQQRRLHFLVNGVVAITGQLANNTFNRHCADLEACGKPHVRRFTDTDIYSQIQEEGRWSSRTASEPLPYKTGGAKERQEAAMDPVLVEELHKGQAVSSLLALFAAFTSRWYAPRTAKKGGNPYRQEHLDVSPAAAQAMHAVACSLFSAFRRRLRLPETQTQHGGGDDGATAAVSALMPRGPRRKQKGKATKDLAPQVQRVRSASIMHMPGGQQILIASEGNTEAFSPPGSPVGAQSMRMSRALGPPSNQPEHHFTQSIVVTHEFDPSDGSRVLFGNEAIVFIADRHELLKATMLLLGTATGASTSTSTTALSKGHKSQPGAAPAGGGHPTHMVLAGSVARECAFHLKRVHDISELLLSAALHSVDGQKRRSTTSAAGINFGDEASPAVRRALFLDKGSSEGGVGASFVLLLLTVITNTREYWREIRRLHVLKGDSCITSMTAAQANSPPPPPPPPRSAAAVVPLVVRLTMVRSVTNPKYRTQSLSLHEKLERDTSLLVDAASALMTRPEVDSDLSPKETRLYHRHRLRYRTLAAAKIAAAGLSDESDGNGAHGDEDKGGHHEEAEDVGVSVVAWLSLRQRLINTIAVVTDIASSMKLFSAAAIQSQAETELYDILIGAKNHPGADEADSAEPELSSNSEALRGSRRNGRSGFTGRMEALRKLAQLHFHGQEEHGGGGDGSVTAGAIAAGGEMIPLTRLIWLLRDLSDLSPILDTRPDVALLALCDDDSVRNVLRALVQASLAVPVHIDEDSSIDKAGQHDAKRQNALFVPGFHHRYHQDIEGSMDTDQHHHQAHHPHSHISNDRTRVRSRVAIALNQARQDLISAAVTIMQILTTDAAAGASIDDYEMEGGETATIGGAAPPMRHETYFQSLVDALVMRCVPSAIATSPHCTIGVVLGQQHDLTPQGRKSGGGRLDHHHYQYGGGYNANTSTGGAPRCAATITTIIETLGSAHLDGLGNEEEGGALPHEALAALLRLRNRIVMRLQAVRMYVLAQIRIECYHVSKTNSVVSEAGRVLARQYSRLAAAAALNNLLHMSPVMAAKAQSRVAGWALGGVERRLVLMEIAELTGYSLGDGQGLAWHQLQAEHGLDGHPTGSLSVEGVPLDMVPTRWSASADSRKPPVPSSAAQRSQYNDDLAVFGDSAGGDGIVHEVEAEIERWNLLSEREENEQRARHLRLVLPPCPARSMSGGHNCASKMLLLALFRANMLPYTAVSSTAEELRANRVGPLNKHNLLSPVSHFESKQVRAVLSALLDSGEWEVGLSLAGVFNQGFVEKVGAVKEALQTAVRTNGGGGGLESRHQQYQQHLRQMLARATKLSEETALSHDLIKRNLLHESDSRLLPIYYAVRITACPWTRAPNLSSPFSTSPFAASDHGKIEALLAATGMELVGVVLNEDGEDDAAVAAAFGATTGSSGSGGGVRGEGDSHTGLAGHAHAGDASLRGTWLLLRYDASAQATAGQHLRTWSSDVAHYVPPAAAEVHVSNRSATTAPVGEDGYNQFDTNGNSAATGKDSKGRPTTHLEPAPGAPLPPTARAVVERSLQLAFPHHMVLPGDFLAAPVSPIAPPHPSAAATKAGAQNGGMASSAADNAAKVIQVFDAFPAPLVDDYYIRKKKAHERHFQRKHAKRAARAEAEKDAQRYGANRRAGGRESFGASFDNFSGGGGGNSSSNPDSGFGGGDYNRSGGKKSPAKDPFFSSTAPGGGIEDYDEYSDSDSDTGDSEEGDWEGEGEHYDNSPLSKKNAILERHRRASVDVAMADDVAGNTPDMTSHLKEVALEDWAAASHADVFYLYVASDPSNPHHGASHHHHHSDAEASGEEGKIVTRLTMSVLSVARGGELSHGHHHGEKEDPHNYHYQQRKHGRHGTRAGPSSWAGHMHTAVSALHFASPCSLLYPVESKNITAFSAGLEIMWYQQKQLKRLSEAIKRAALLTPGEIKSHTLRDLSSLDSVLAGVATQCMNMLMQPFRNPCSLANGRSLIAGELDRIEKAQQKERKLMKRAFIQSQSFEKNYRDQRPTSDFFAEAPMEPDFAGLEEKYQRKRNNVQNMTRLRDTCLGELKEAVGGFRSCTELLHHAYEDLGKAGGKPGSIMELDKDSSNKSRGGGVGEGKSGDHNEKSDMWARYEDDVRVSTVTMLNSQVERDDSAQLYDTWTQLTLLLESSLATLEVGTTI